MKKTSLLLAALALTTPAFAQSGDKKDGKDENQELRVPKEKIPAAPPLSPADAQKTFSLAPGFRIELVASEPMIQKPVEIEFDERGRIWCVEMRGFMSKLPGADGKGDVGEQLPVGRISVLEDTDGDGRMDRATTFLDGLVMPRALALARGGVLVAEPPKLWFCRDTDGDLKCDEKTEVAADYGSQANPEHTANGLLWAMDNWIYSANHTVRFRNTTGKWEREPTTGRGQWGLSQDDFGRLFYNGNSDMIRADMVPTHYAVRRGPGAKLPGAGHAVADKSQQAVHPVRVNPGVNRGYQKATLRADGTLATVTAACGPVVYRGEQFPAEFRGNGFVCEPSGNVVIRNVLSESGGEVSSKLAFTPHDFIASTDERFRPVNLNTGPDGCLYVVDMYHGILQHRIYMTSYLRQQVEERGLDKPSNLGRIWRVVHDGAKPAPAPKLADATPAQLVAHLASSNGWTRDTAQRLLVERADAAAVTPLTAAATAAGSERARLHALWALDGMGKLDTATLEKALSDKSGKVRAAAIRLTETSPDKEKFLPRLHTMAGDTAPEPQIQLALTLGVLAPTNAASKALLGTMKTSATAKLAQAAAAFTLTPPPVAKANPKAAPMTAEHKKQFEVGKAVYEATCLGCHQAHGNGQAGQAPPLVGSEWVSGSEERLVRIVLHGMRGPMKVKGELYELEMAALGILDDEQIAAAITYTRREWGHAFPAVAPATVKRIRDATAQRTEAWTEKELLSIP